jgi:aconitate hydratase
MHETNLKKRGILPWNFLDLEAWGRIKEDDRIEIIGVGDIKPRETLTMVMRNKDESR